MRILSAVAMCAVLAGCVTDKQPTPELTGINPAHDSYCRSLLMPPGTLVYVQCRLAMSETLREAEDRAKQRLEDELGMLPPEVESALHDDMFCNFNEASKLSVQPGEAAALAITASAPCDASRARLEEVLRAAFPIGADAALQAYGRDTFATNEATIAEARAFR